MTRQLEIMLIWGHGLPYEAEILDMVRATPALEIIQIVRRKVRNIRWFIQRVYQYDRVPREHLEAKTRYLLSVPRAITGVLLNNRNPQPTCFGEGAFAVTACRRMRELKEAIRNRFNPRLSDGRRSEEHVVHFADGRHQVLHLLRLLGITMDPESLLYGHSSAIVCPSFLPEPTRICLRQLRADTLRCTVLRGNPDKPTRHICRIEDSPHFRFIIGQKADYEQYWKQYGSRWLGTTHSPGDFEKLNMQFDYLCPPHENEYILVHPRPDGTYVILDGLHRAAILCARGVSEWINAIIT